MQINKKRMFAIVIVIAFCLIGLSVAINTSQKNSDQKHNGNKHSNQSNKKELDKSSIFLVNFLDPQKPISGFFKEDINNHQEIYNKESQSAPPDFGVGKNLNSNNFDINFNDLLIAGGHANESYGNESHPIINDIDYMRQFMQNNPGFESSTEVETVFVSDDVENSLMSCIEFKGKYTCHTAVSNLNNPLDILVINNYIYIINSHQQNQAGSYTRCRINNYGFIDSCGQTALNIINPAWFYYNPPNVHISDFVYSGDSKKVPKSAIQCNVDNRGNFINCNPDSETLSMYYISKAYNGYYYRPHSFGSAHIAKCATVDADFCTNLYNQQLVYPLSLSFNNNRMFISNQKSGSGHNILKCSVDLKTCEVITNSISSPKCISVFNFKSNNNW